MEGEKQPTQYFIPEKIEDIEKLLPLERVYICDRGIVDDYQFVGTNGKNVSFLRYSGDDAIVRQIPLNKIEWIEMWRVPENESKCFKWKLMKYREYLIQQMDGTNLILEGKNEPINSCSKKKTTL